MTRKSINYLLTIALVTSGFCTFESCKTKSVIASSVKKTDKDYTDGVVHNFKGRDGCDYAIEINGKNYEPINLTENFQKDNLKVKVRYKEDKQKASICMIGPMIKILEIVKAE